MPKKVLPKLKLHLKKLLEKSTVLAMIIKLKKKFLQKPKNHGKMLRQLMMKRLQTMNFTSRPMKKNNFGKTP